MASPQHPWRCFVAVPIGPALREALDAFASGLRDDPALGRDWRWTQADGWHVTLAFLGSTEPSRVPTIASALADVAGRFEPFTLTAGGLGAFPSSARARVVWYGIADPDGRLRRLARDVQASVGLEAEARFRAHLTLARARERFGTDAGQPLSRGEPPAGRVEVDRLVLYRSHLGRGPAQYEELSVAMLAGAAA